MRGLTEAERTFRLELAEALLVYNLGGEQIFLPFQKEDGASGILANHMAGFSTQRLLALLTNSAVRRHIREQFPEMYHELCERSFSNNDVEAFFSEVATQLGYKPSARTLLGRLRKIDFAMRTQYAHACSLSPTLLTVYGTHLPSPSMGPHLPTSTHPPRSTALTLLHPACTKVRPGASVSHHAEQEEAVRPRRVQPRARHRRVERRLGA